MRDRLELSFSRVSRGGGEVDKLEYDKHTGTGRVTFLNTGGVSASQHDAVFGFSVVNVFSFRFRLTDCR